MVTSKTFSSIDLSQRFFSLSGRASQAIPAPELEFPGDDLPARLPGPIQVPDLPIDLPAPFRFPPARMPYPSGMGHPFRFPTIDDVQPRGGVLI